jgi:predicted  nucleic acid-binding Zn ribbon protein
MKVFDIIIDISKSGYEDTEIEHILWTYLVFLNNTSQITNDDYIFTKSGDTVRVRVVCPEPDSLFVESTTTYVKQARQKLEQLIGFPIRYKEVGTEPQASNYRVPQNSSFYILRYGWFSPLICGDTFTPIPLYYIPPTHHDGLCYDNLHTWERNYKRLYGLWLSGLVGERFALKQMQHFDSIISLVGRELCQRIEDLTGKPTYYFLFNYRGWSKAQDLARKCPITGQEWILPGKTSSDYIAFKCDESRLVSELSANIGC